MYSGTQKRGYYDDLTIAEVDQEYLDRLYQLSLKEETPKGRTHYFRNHGKFTKLAKIVAVVLLFFSATTVTSILMSPEAVSAVKGVFTRNVAQSQDGALILGGDTAVGPEKASEKTSVIVNWADVLKQKEAFPQMGIPGYVPEGYAFQSLDLRIEEDDYKIEYLYRNTAEAFLCIKQYKQLDMEVQDTKIAVYDEVLHVDDVEVYVSNSTAEGFLSATYNLGEDKINISGNLSDEELAEMVRSYQK